MLSRPTLYRGESYVSEDSDEIEVDKSQLGDIGRTPHWFKKIIFRIRSFG